jgi:predicted amidohydrolase YtcJ
MCDGSAREKDPPGGFFVRVAGTRTITGAHEYAEYILRQRLSMMADEPAHRKALSDYSAEAVGFGITSAQVMTNRPAADLARSAAASDLPIRFRVIDFPLDGMRSWRQPASASIPGSARVAVSGTQWILDGTPLERLMFLRERYADHPATRGQLNFPAADLAAFLKLALGRREQPMLHAVGDATLDAVLLALEQSGGDSHLSRSVGSVEHSPTARTAMRGVVVSRRRLRVKYFGSRSGGWLDARRPVGRRRLSGV